MLIGMLTSGGDCPGLNAAMRGIGKTAIIKHGTKVVGIKDGFRGLMENRIVQMDSKSLSGILTIGGTILGTSRDKPYKMQMGEKTKDMTDVIVENYHKNHLDALVCLGGGGTQKNAYHLYKEGLNVITLPKTIDNDVACTDITFGFDTALEIAVDAIDRLHSTALSHHRIIVVEIMGNNSGWLALGAGISGGADVILIPEIPYDTEKVAESIIKRKRAGKSFSIVAVAEGCISKETASLKEELKEKKRNCDDKELKKSIKQELEEIESLLDTHTYRLASKLKQLTGIDARVTILGHLQRGGTPSATDRLLATRLGVAAGNLIHQGTFGVMCAVKGSIITPIPLETVVKEKKLVPPDHDWITSARDIGICLGD
jgi:ATP-dependent phosphofructokinase / diphosphate-dependent phosphofructokinase